MGVTIHFEGQLNSDADFERVIATVKEFAIENDIEYSVFNEPFKILHRVKDEQDWDYQGLTKGIKLQPDINSDPLIFEFDKDNCIQEYCKTQFAGVDIHIKIINLLRQIQKYFADLSVTDEGEFWHSSDKDLLQRLFEDFYAAAEKAKMENPKLSGPFRLKDGRIVDLMESD